MNMLIEPVELQEAECNAQGWQIAGALDDPAPDDLPAEMSADGVRVVAWMVDRICALPAGPAQ